MTVANFCDGFLFGCLFTPEKSNGSTEQLAPRMERGLAEATSRLGWRRFGGGERRNGRLLEVEKRRRKKNHVGHCNSAAELDAVYRTPEYPHPQLHSAVYSHQSVLTDDGIPTPTI